MGVDAILSLSHRPAYFTRDSPCELYRAAPDNQNKFNARGEGHFALVRELEQRGRDLATGGAAVSTRGPCIFSIENA